MPFYSNTLVLPMLTSIYYCPFFFFLKFSLPLCVSDLTVVINWIFLLVKFHELIGHLYIFFRENSIQIISAFWASAVVYCWVVKYFLIYCAYYLLNSIWLEFLPLCGFRSTHFLRSVTFSKTILILIRSVYCSCVACASLSYLRNYYLMVQSLG